MSRKRTPCDFCSGEYESEYKDHRNGYCLWLEVYPFNNLIAVICQARDDDGEFIEDSVQLPMNFCPNCGAKMDETVDERRSEHNGKDDIKRDMQVIRDCSRRNRTNCGQCY